MPGEQFQQLVGGGLAVERGDAVGNRSGIADHLLAGDIGLLTIAGLIGDGVIANPENMLDP
ncbi:hypothetical protein D3C75_1328360 [compost metagenome]